MFITKLAKHTQYTSRIFLKLKELQLKGHNLDDEYLVETTEEKIILTKLKK